MALLSTFSLPLSTNGPPAGYDWEEREMSLLSTTIAFDVGVEQRDIFLGQHRCVICGLGWPVLRPCQIIRDLAPDVWSNLKLHRWIPPHAKDTPRHEPRNGILMCMNHRAAFDKYLFFIRFIPNTRKFVFVNYTNHPIFQPYHGKAIGLDVRDCHAPFPSLFIIHEMRVRGFHSFQPVAPVIPRNLAWQDWILSGGVFNDTSGSFNRAAPPGNANDNNDNGGSAQIQLATTSAGARSSIGLTSLISTT